MFLFLEKMEEIYVNVDSIQRAELKPQKMESSKNVG